MLLISFAVRVVESYHRNDTNGYQRQKHNAQFCNELLRKLYNTVLQVSYYYAISMIAPEPTLLQVTVL